MAMHALERYDNRKGTPGRTAVPLPQQENDAHNLIKRNGNRFAAGV